MNVRIMRTDDIRPIDHNSNDSGALTAWGDGSEDMPFEEPLAVLDTEEDVRDWLDDTYREAREDGIILPFPDDEEDEEEE